MRQLHIFLLNQNFTWDCLLISVFLPDLILKLLWTSKQNNFIFRSGKFSLGKNTEINKRSHVKFWFNRKNYGAVSYLFSCKSTRRSLLYCKIYSCIHYLNSRSYGTLYWSIENSVYLGKYFFVTNSFVQ